jgi:hypothetical protein
LYLTIFLILLFYKTLLKLTSFFKTCVYDPKKFQEI